MFQLSITKYWLSALLVPHWKIIENQLLLFNENQIQVDPKVSQLIK